MEGPNGSRMTSKPLVTAVTEGHCKLVDGCFSDAELTCTCFNKEKREHS